MRHILLVIAAVLVVGVMEVRAERASVVVAKATVTAVTATVKAVPKAPAATWRGVKWVIAHI